MGSGFLHQLQRVILAEQCSDCAQGWSLPVAFTSQGGLACRGSQSVQQLLSPSAGGCSLPCQCPAGSCRGWGYPPGHLELLSLCAGCPRPEAYVRKMPIKLEGAGAVFCPHSKKWGSDPSGPHLHTLLHYIATHYFLFTLNPQALGFKCRLMPSGWTNDPSLAESTD